MFHYRRALCVEASQGVIAHNYNLLDLLHSPQKPKSPINYQSNQLHIRYPRPSQSRKPINSPPQKKHKKNSPTTTITAKKLYSHEAPRWASRGGAATGRPSVEPPDGDVTSRRRQKSANGEKGKGFLIRPWLQQVHNFESWKKNVRTFFLTKVRREKRERKRKEGEGEYELIRSCHLHMVRPSDFQ